MTNKPIIETKKYKRLSITIEYVFRAYFNDTYWLEELNFDLYQLAGEKPIWIDPYHGRSKTGSTSIAVLSCSDEKLVLLKNENGTVKKEEADSFWGCTLCEDYDESLLLAAHIRIR